MCVVLGRPADRGGRAMQHLDHTVELRGDLGQFRKVVPRRKAPGVPSAFADLPRHPGEAPQAAANPEKRR